MAGEAIYILYSYVFGLNFISLETMTSEQDHWCHQKEIFCLFYYVQIHISQICTLCTKIQGYHLTQYLLHTWIIFRFFFYVEISHLLQRREGIGIRWNNLQPGFP